VVLKLDKSAIRNILSIRYNPLNSTLSQQKKWQDFVSKKTDPMGIITEKKLKKSAIKLLSFSDEPVSISLSSGIDSTLSIGIIRNVFPKRKIIAICGIFEGGYDESKAAQKIAEKFDADFHTVIMDSMFTNIPEIISITKKPKWNTYNHIIAKKATKFSKVLVTGDGADEIFAGYTFRYKKFLNLLRPKDNWKIKTKNYLECHNRDWVPDQEYLFGSAIKFNWEEIYEYFKKYFSNPLSPLQQVLLADFNGKLIHDFIPTGKSIYSYYKLQGVSMFLDSEVISFVLQSMHFV